MIIISILLILVILVGSAIAYLTFFDKNGGKEYLFGLDVNFLDFTQLSDEEEEAFLGIATKVDEAFVQLSGRKFRNAFPEYALSYICRDVEDYLDKNYDEFLKKLGSNISTSEKVFLKYEVKDTDALEEKFKELFGVDVKIDTAYVVENICTFTGDDGSTRVADVYLFYREEKDWKAILIAGDGLSDFGIK